MEYVASPFFLRRMELPTSRQTRPPQMDRLAESISKYGECMRELGRLEATRNNTCDCAQREDLTRDLEEVAARVAIAKASMLGAKASDGSSLIEWSEDEAN